MVEPLLVGAFVVRAFAGGGAFVVGAFAGSIVFFFLKKASSVSESSESESELSESFRALFVLDFAAGFGIFSLALITIIMKQF